MSVEAEPVDVGCAPRSFRVVTPANWLDLDLDPRTSRAATARLVAGAVGGAPAAVSARRQLTSLLRQATRAAADKGAVFSSFLSDVIEGRPVAASLLASMARSDQTEGDSLTALAEQLERSQGSQSRPATATVVKLGAGPAVRLRRRTMTEALSGEGGWAEVESVQYFLSVPGTRNLLVLSFSTPNLALSEAFAELFDAMAESLSWEW